MGKTTIAPEKAVGVVKKALKKLKSDYPAFGKVSIDVKFIKQEDDWLYVAVVPKKWPKNLYGFYEMLSKAESEVEEQGLGNVLLVPARNESEG